jgi:propanediol dehydratase small subunit
VIGCGAGFSPNYPPHFDLHPCYIGVIGNRDFNYQEMLRLDDWLSKFEIDHYIYEFAGGHEWPPAEVLTNAVTWLEFRAMENDLIWTDYTLREDFYEDRLNLVNTFMKQGNTFSAYLEAVELKSYLHGIRRLEDLDIIINTLKSDAEVRRELLRRKQILEEERAYYKEYMEAFNSYQLNLENSMTQAKPISYWKDQLKIAQSKTDVGNDMYEVLLGRRMIDFIWRTAYQQYESIQGTEYQILSKDYLEIWLTVQPDAISPYFFMARYYTLMGKYSKAMDYLNEAVSRGLDDPALIEGDTVLVRLTTLPEYRTVAARIGD